MRGLLSSILLIVATAAVANAHVIAVYNGMNIPIRGSGTADETQTTAGPCGDNAQVFGISGVTKMAPGELLNLQLKYAQNHRIAGGNTFMVAMACTDGDGSALNSDSQLRQSVAANQKNRVAMSTLNVPDEALYSMPLQLPAKSPAGMTLKDGDFCTVSIMDQRDWGGCVDLRITNNPGPIIAGVLAPVTVVGAAAAIWFGRGRIQGKLLPSSAEAARPDLKINQSMRWSFVTMVIAIISCSVPAWSKGDGFGTGPWLYCPTSNAKCSDSAMLGFPAIYAVRFFVITAVLAIIFAFFAPILVYYRKLNLPALVAAKFQIGAFIYAGIAQFIAFMLWVCIFGGGSNPGWALYMDIIAFAFSFACALISISWMNHIKMGPDTSSSSATPVAVVTGEPIVKKDAAPVPAPTKAIGSGPKAYATHATPTSDTAHKTHNFAAAKPVAAPAVELKYTKKWGSWEEIWDEENQAYYFFNHSNGESAWDRPVGWPSL